MRGCFGACTSGRWGGTGVARRLVEAVVDAARPCVELLQLSVVVGNEPARRLSAGLGFVEYGIERKLVKQNGRYYDEILMALDLTSAPALGPWPRDPHPARRRVPETASNSIRPLCLHLGESPVQTAGRGRRKSSRLRDSGKTAMGDDEPEECDAAGLHQFTVEAAECFFHSRAPS